MKPTAEAQLTHTPLPWRFKPNGGSPFDRSRVLGPPHPIDGGDYSALATLANPDDARLIVRAVNHHASLVQALSDAATALEAIPVSNRGVYFKYRQKQVDNIRAVLAAVGKGGV